MPKNRPTADQKIRYGLRTIQKVCANHIMPEGFWEKFDELAEILTEIPFNQNN